MDNSKSKFYLKLECLCPTNFPHVAAPTQRRREERPPPPGPKNFVEWYLLSYNQVSTMGWCWILFITVAHLYTNEGDYTGVFDVVWPALSYVQTAALFEVSI